MQRRAIDANLEMRAALHFRFPAYPCNDLASEPSSDITSSVSAPSGSTAVTRACKRTECARLAGSRGFVQILRPDAHDHVAPDGCFE
jgi:hypothetical protein